MKRLACFILLGHHFLSMAQTKKEADLIVFNARVYTVNAKFETAEAFAIKGGKVLAVGATKDLIKKYKGKQLDAGGKTIVPGFIDAHAHFYAYGEGLQTVDLVGTKSWNEVMERIESFSKSNTEGWLVGRGWDQNDWETKEYPNKKQLDERFPNRPVFLSRVDGHGAICNQKALDLAHISPNQTLVGGEIETKDGALTGILVDNAVGLVETMMPAKSEKQIKESLLDAQKKCFAVGLTTIADCGLDFPLVEIIEKTQKEKALKMRLFVMLSDDRKNYEYLFKRGKIKTDRLNVRSFKLYADGALGSRGACLLHPYADRANYFGFLLKDTTYYRAVLTKIAENGFQACTHAIGDSANRTILKLYSEILTQQTPKTNGKNDMRWRIEHAQVVDNQDFSTFGRFNIIPSVQPTHATSDMYWAAQRLGKEPVKTAYAYKQLMKENGWIPLGTDFPVENIDPILTFFAAVVRQDAKGFPEGGFQFENALTKEETLRGMTIWAAKSNFEETEKGSIEVGKFADFIILNQDLMTVKNEDILKTKVLKTYLNGELVFEKK